MTHTHKGRQRSPYIDFHVMVGGIARECMTTQMVTTESLKRGVHTPANRLTDIQPWFIASFFDIGHLLWSIDTRQNKVSTDQYHMILLWAQV